MRRQALTDPAGRDRRAVQRDGYGLGFAVGLYGASFGAAAVTAGLSTAQASVLSLLMFTGASQFALIGVLGAGGGAAAAVAGALLLGSRNTLYAVRLASLLPERGVRRLAAAQVTIDESTAMAVAAPVEHARAAFWATGLGVFVFWNLFTLLGALGAAQLGDPAALGLDALVPAAFLALLWPQLVARSRVALAVAGALVALLALPVVPAGVPVLLAGLVVVPALVRR